MLMNVMHTDVNEKDVKNVYLNMAVMWFCAQSRKSTSQIFTQITIFDIKPPTRITDLSCVASPKVTTEESCVMFNEGLSRCISLLDMPLSTNDGSVALYRTSTIIDARHQSW